MKRKFTALLLTLAMLCAYVMPAYASEQVTLQEVQAYAEEEYPQFEPGELSLAIQPRWLRMQYVVHGVTFDGSKSKTVVDAATYNSTDRIELTVTLQQEDKNYSFQDYKTWTSSGVGTCTMYKEWYVSKGTYRVKTVAAIYNSAGVFQERITLYSSSKTYS